jgi:MATE family multidrug resistance protein
MNFNTATKQLLFLSFPMVLGQIGQMLIGAGDVYMASLYSTKTVASIGVANGVINPIFLFGIGLMMGVSPSLATSRGEGNNDRNTLSSIITYAALVGIALTLLTLLVGEFLVPHMGFDPIMIPSMQDYIRVVSWSLPFAIIFQAIKEYLQAYEEVFIPNLLSIIAVALNLIVNYILIFGYGDYEGVGEIGLAYASLFIRVLLFFAILAYVLSKEKIYKVSRALIANIFKFSLPIAFMFFIEVLAFCTVTILSGKLGIVQAAANNIIMTIASIAFMVPLSVSSAVAIKVGHSFGKKNYELIKMYSLSSVAIILCFVGFSASTFFFIPEQILAFTTSDQEVIVLGVKILFVVAFFQIVDSLQVIFSGILRGLNNTTVSSILVFIGYWVIGIPIGVYLGFYSGQGAYGLWIGLAISLTMTALFLFCYLSVRLKKIKETI